MAKHGFKVFDSDMHIMEPPDLWERYIAREFKSEAPRGRTSENVLKPAYRRVVVPLLECQAVGLGGSA